MSPILLSSPAVRSLILAVAGQAWGIDHFDGHRGCGLRRPHSHESQEGTTYRQSVSACHVFPKCRYDDRKRLIEGLVKTGHVKNLEAPFVRKNGDLGIGLMSARILHINHEDVIQSITKDITERKKPNAIRRMFSFLAIMPPPLHDSMGDPMLNRSGLHITTYYPAVTAIWRGMAFSALGRVRRSTPSSCLASILL